jgi:hypothetical protein
MSYNSIVYTEQGGSVLRVETGGSVVVKGPLTLYDGGGTNSTMITVGTGIPTHSASPGALYIRSAGSVSGLYINKSLDTSGSLWAAASANLP